MSRPEFYRLKLPDKLVLTISHLNVDKDKLIRYMQKRPSGVYSFNHHFDGYSQHGYEAEVTDVAAANELLENMQMLKTNVAGQFWLIWREGGSPTVCHTSRVDANKEAERLAGLHPQYEFFVMEAVDKYTAVNVRHEKLR